jgi:hypothetical protein
LQRRGARRSSQRSRQAIMLRLGGFVLWQARIVADRHNHKFLDASPPPSWAETWHLWTMIIPAAIDHRRLVGKSLPGGAILQEVH